MINACIGYMCHNYSTNKYIGNTADETSIFVRTLKMREHHISN